jgi:toxin ParE1/3/4
MEHPENVEFHEDATAEADRAYLRYHEADPRVAERFREALRVAVGLIAEGPDRYADFTRHTKVIQLRKFPYHLIYQVIESKVHVVAVAHGRRRSYYWRRRLKK